jgi:GrpB-like predicted nucleotidyltransferase (UPF0157 family)
MTSPDHVRQRLHGEATTEQIRAGWVDGPPRPLDEPIRVSAHDPAWERRFVVEAERIRVALGPVAVSVEHVGSTAVPDLCAKPVVDIDLLVADSDEEDAYVPALVEIGFRLVLREPWWWGHRMLITGDHAVNLHVFSADAGEPVRHILFRDWLRQHVEDRQRYAEAKRRLAKATTDDPAAYNLAKNTVIDDIFERIWAAQDAEDRR